MEGKALRVQLERRVDSCWSWVVCFSSFIVQFLILGTHNSFGSFFVALLGEFQRSEAETAWIGSLAMGITYMAAPIATSLCDRWGCRVVMCLGSVTYMAAMLLTSVVQHMSLMYITYGVLFGFASSCCYFSSFYILILYFNKHLALANGIAAAGAGAGTMSLSLTVDKLITSYGLRITFRGLAASSLFLFLAGLTFLPIDFREGEDEFLKKEALLKEQEEIEIKDNLIKYIKELLKPAPVWGNKAFGAWTVALAMVLIAYYIPYMYLIRLAESVGIPSAQGALLVGYFALAQTVGKIFFGKLGDSSRVSRLTLTQTALLVIAVAACLCPLAQSHTALLTYSMVSGLFDGCLCVMIGLVTHDIVGRQMMAKAVGTLYGIVAIPMTVGPPMAGLLFDSTGSYNIVFFLSSGLVIGGSCVMFLIPILFPAKPSRLKVITPDIILSMPDKLQDNDDIGLLEGDKAKLRTSHTSFRSFANDLEICRSRSLLDRTPNLRSRPSSFVLFSIVPEGSFRDLSQLNERYSNSREASYASLVRLSEIIVDSRVSSCARLEPVAEAEISDSGLSPEFLEVIKPQTPVPELYVTASRSCECINESISHVMAVDLKVDSAPAKIVSQSTESGFASEESVATTCDNGIELISSSSDLDEKRLSGYSWNSTGSDLSCKTECSEAGTEDSGYGDESTQVHCVAEGSVQIDVHRKPSINTCVSKDNLQPDLRQDNGYCSCESSLDVRKSYTELTGSDDEAVAEHAQKGLFIENASHSNFYTGEKKRKVSEVSHCTCGEDEDDAVNKLISDAKEIIELKKPYTSELPQPPDIYSELFEEVLEEVNEYVENFSELTDYQGTMKILPKVSMTDLISCEQETVI
ncbi:uncharacterized protein LOC111340820 [Stylophora pistillata]|uniref:Monocarboxylate transporter 10 n=1 Tax=Stylophora pistillata TaxID=50429 RepID=A0A2B4RKX6_STYPI|nr:uncharacterized protein LOC111340820 [Stylophora pistillata]PFX17453.1 Monocarboxylate transporter 10 [Stylophora pistillata]